MKIGVNYPFLPKGSYLFSCANVSVDLFCQSLNREKEWIPAHFTLTTTEKANLQNQNGRLVNSEGKAGNAQGFIPGGTYLSTSREVRVFLAAICSCQNLHLQWSTLEITHLPPNVRVINENGVLKVS